MSKTCVCVLAALTVIAGNVSTVAAGSRKVKPGDPTPEFSVQDLSGSTYTYNREEKRALVVTFLSSGQTRSSKAQTDLVKILSGLDESLAKAMDVVIALNDPNAFTGLTELKTQFAGRLIVTLDQDHHLWGRFGVIAMPTVVSRSDSKYAI